MKTVMTKTPSDMAYDESNFDKMFVEFDTNGDGLIDKEEMSAFINGLLVCSEAK